MDSWMFSWRKQQKKERPSKWDRSLSKWGYAVAEGQSKLSGVRAQAVKPTRPRLLEPTSQWVSSSSFADQPQELHVHGRNSLAVKVIQGTDSAKTTAWQREKDKEGRKEEEGRGGRRKKKRRDIITGMDYILIFTAVTALLAQHKYK